MPIYEYICSKCRGITEVLQATMDGGTKTTKCAHCGARAKKIISIPNIGSIKSGFKAPDALMQDPETGDTIPMTKDHMITGTPREEESRAVQDFLDIQALRNQDPQEYQRRKAEFDMKALDSDPDGREVDPEEMETYWKKPGEGADKERPGLSHPGEPDRFVKVGEKVVGKGAKKRHKPILVEKKILQRRK